MKNKKEPQIEGFKGEDVALPLNEKEKNESIIAEPLLQEEIVIQDELLTANFFEALKKFVYNNGIECDTDDKVSLFATILKKLDDDHLNCLELSRQNQVIAAAIADNPRLMIFLQELINETPIRVALVKSDLADLKPCKGDDDYDEYNLAIIDSRNRRKRVLQQTQQRKERCDVCNEIALRFYTEIAAEKGEIEGFIAFLNGVIDSIFEANIDRDFLASMWKAYTFDSEVKEAREIGELEGRNLELLKKRDNRTDGLPSAIRAKHNHSHGDQDFEAGAKDGYIERLMRRQFGR